MDAVRWRLRERVLDPFGEDSAEVGLRAALSGAGDPPAGESFRSMALNSKLDKAHPKKEISSGTKKSVS